MGGIGYEEAYSIQQTADGGYIVAGWSNSNDGDVTGNHGNGDCWIVKLDSNGIISWQKSFGGSSGDGAYSIEQTADGGYIVAGWSESIDGDVTGNHGGLDYLIVKLDSNGVISWQKSLGGSDYDYAESIQQTADGGYIVAGFSGSIDGDVTGNHGGLDYWVAKLNSNGIISWQKSLGGSGEDVAKSIQQTADGGYIVAGYSASNDGDVMGHYAARDYWIVKLDSNGAISWQKSLGGSGDDVAFSIEQTADGGYIVAGWSDSNNGDVTVSYGHPDYWIVKLTAVSTISWQKSLGGSDTDYANAIQPTIDGGYIVAGRSFSNDGDVTGHHGLGNIDYWIVKLGGTTAISPNIIWEGLSIYPNPNKGDFLLEGLKEDDYPLQISILDVSTSVVYQQRYSSFTESIPLHLLIPKGLYFLKAQSEKGIVYQKFIME